MRVGIEEFRPERLSLAREFRIRTKKSLADAIGTSSSNLTKWEAGDHKPEERHLHDLAWELDFPHSWFLGEASVGASGQRHRSLKSSLKRQKLRMSAALAMMDSTVTYLDDFVEFIEPNLPGGGWSTAASISEEEILNAAIECRAAFGFGLNPAGDIVDGMEEFGVLVARCEVGGTKIDGVSAWANSSGHPLVLLATDKANPARSRFDAAHELGHLVLHRHIKPISFDDESERKDEFELQERQANLFASEFLLPTQAFVSDLNLVHLDEFADLKLKWNTSIKMMIYKARKLGLIDADYYKQLLIYYNSRGWNRREPHDEVMNFEQPHAIREALEFVIGADPKRLYDAEQRSGLNGSLMEELFSFKPSLDPNDNLVVFRRAAN